MDNVPAEVQRALLQQEIQGLHNGVFMLTARHKARKRIGDAESLKAIEAEIEKTEALIAAFEDQLKEIA